MNIDCCKSYVGKQIIGLAPGGSVTPPAQKCFYLGYLDTAGIATTDMYFDAALTQPMFINNIGDGTLRYNMQILNGELFFPLFDPNSFIQTGMHIFYEGTSATPIDIYYFGGLLNTINFTKVTDLGLTCNPIQCFTLTYDNTYTKLENLFFVTPLVTASLYMPNNPPFNAYIDLNNITSMTLLLKELYGNSVNYTYVDNGNGTSTITIDKMLNWSGLNQIDVVLSDGANGADFSFIPC